ncbi:MAG TPA: TIGR00725 family protein [Thermoleophilaceae bacterium]
MAVVGPGEGGDLAAAEEVGRLLGQRGATLVCGGLGGVMEAACRGAKETGGSTVGILPGDHRAAANEFVDVAIATGLGEGRNLLVVRSAEAVIAIGGAYGTLSEIALALRAGKRVVGLDTWDIDGVERADSPEAAVETVLSDLST